MNYIKPDHRTGIAFAAEGLADLIQEQHNLYRLIGVIVEKLEQESPHSTALALAYIAQSCLNHSGTLHEVRDLIADLRAAFPVDSEVRE